MPLPRVIKPQLADGSPLPLGTELARMCGYEGGARWVALYWEPAGDEVMWDDGLSSATGEWYPFLEYTGRAPIRAALPYNLGSSDGPATAKLLIYMPTGTVYVGATSWVDRFLYSQCRRWHQHPVELPSPVDLDSLLNLIKVAMMSYVPPNMAEIEEMMFREAASLEMWKRQLDAWQAGYPQVF